MAQLQRVLISLGLLLACAATTGLGQHVPNNVTLGWNSLLSDLMCQNGAIFHRTAFYHSILNLAQWHSLLALRSAGSSATSQEAVVAFASHYVLAQYFRYQQTTLLDPYLQGQLDALNLSLEQKNLAKLIAHSVAAPLVTSRQSDGVQYNLDSFKYPELKDALPGEFSWSAPPEDHFFPFAKPLLEELVTERTFVLPPPEVFRSSYLPDIKPPAVPSDEFDKLYETAFTYGRRNSTKRTPDQTASAHFWAGEAINGACNQVTPWIKGAITAMPPGTALYDAVLVMAKLSVAAYDASVLFINVQHTFRFWRPATAIRKGDPNHPPVPDWLPELAFTPSHPEYPSGTATVAGACQCILEAYIKNPSTVVMGGGAVSGSVVGAPRTFKSWLDAAQDAANGRVFGGVHWRKSVQDALSMGCRVAQYLMKNWAKPVPTGVLPSSSALVLFSDEIDKLGDPTPPTWPVLPTSAADYDAPFPRP